MIADRPDWCISRQRNWGVPLPFFLHKDTGELHPRTMEILDQRRRHGRARRHRGLEHASRPRRSSAPRTRAHYTKSTDILDVWFDSGSTFYHVLRGIARRRGATRAAPRPTCTSKATTSTAAGSTRRC